MVKEQGRPTVAMTIAGSDSGGGAGIQADLKTFAAHGVYGTSAITAVTAQNTQTVAGVSQLTPEAIGFQIDTVYDDIAIDLPNHTERPPRGPSTRSATRWPPA